MNSLIDRLIKDFNRKGWPLFWGTEDKPHNLNLIGLRSPSTQANHFDDLLFVLWGTPEQPFIHGFPVTTDPGTYWLQNGRTEGTAIVVPGRYPGLWKVGRHKNQYRALVQNAPVQVYRDSNKDTVLNKDAPVQSGRFGINLHRAGPDSAQVDKWSAGCQVMKRSSDFALLMGIVDAQIADGYGDRFTYSLIDTASDWPFYRPFWEIAYPAILSRLDVPSD